MQNLPYYVYATFGVTTLFSIGLFWKALHYSKPFMAGLLFWFFLQSALSMAGFYNQPETIASRIPFLLGPTLLTIGLVFATERGRAFADGVNLPLLTLFHIIRVPVELVLFWLFVFGAVPEAMSFHGRNFDVLSGLTAPFLYYFGFVKKKLSWKAILVWNVVCLALLINIVSTAMLALPGRYQHYGFEVPNVAVGHFPFVWLPAVLVPMVLFSMLVALRRMLKYKENAVGK